MKKIVAIVSISLLTITGYSQKCVIANSKENSLYIGLSNSLEVVVEGYKCQDIIMTTDNGKLEKQENACGYFITPDSIGKSIITIYSRKKPSKILGRVQFRVKNIPDPVAMVARQTGGSISKTIFKAQIGITADILNMDIDAHMIVTGFNVTIFRKNQVVASKYSDNAHYSDEIKKMFEQIEIGDRIVFSSITYKGTAKSGYLMPIEFLISR